MLRLFGIVAAAFVLLSQAAIAQTASPQQVAGDGCIYCSFCYLGGEGHDALDGPGDFANPHSECVPYNGCGHPSCGSASLSPEDVQQMRDLDTLLDDVTTEGIEVLTAILTDFPELATLNAERSAIQVVSACPENLGLIAHVPLSTKQVAMLLESREPSLVAAN